MRDRSLITKDIIVLCRRTKCKCGVQMRSLDTQILGTPAGNTSGTNKMSTLGTPRSPWRRIQTINKDDNCVIRLKLELILILEYALVFRDISRWRYCLLLIIESEG